jgi:hypothetical protein
MEYIISDPRFFAVVFLIGSTTPLTSAFIGRLHREKKDSERGQNGAHTICLGWGVEGHSQMKRQQKSVGIFQYCKALMPRAVKICDGDDDYNKADLRRRLPFL